MEGGCREHHPEIAVSRRHRGSNSVPFLFPEKRDGTLGAAQEACLGFVQQGKTGNLLQIRCHEGKWLLVPLFATTQLPDRLFVAGIHRQVIASHPLDRNNAPLPEQANRSVEGIAGNIGFYRRGEPKAWPADRAGVGLGMEPAAGGIVVLGPAGGAHGKRCHGGERSVVGDAGDDGVARAAVGAVDEGVAVAPVCRVKQLSETVRANIAVGRYHGPAFATSAGKNGEPGLPRRNLLRATEFGYHRQRRCFGRDRLAKRRQILRLPFRFDLNAAAGIAHPSPQAMFVGKPVDKGTKPNPLDDSFYFQSYPFNCVRLIREGRSPLTLYFYSPPAPAASHTSQPSPPRSDWRARRWLCGD